MLNYTRFFDLQGFDHPEVFSESDWVWSALSHLPAYLEAWFKENESAVHGQVSERAHLIGEHIYIGAGSVIEDGVTIHGPTIIGDHCEIRQGAYIRGDCILGHGAVLGHASEMKGSILLNDAKAPHFAYVGDSILGREVNLGAGTKLSNLAVSSEKDLTTGKRPGIQLSINGQIIDTGLAKMGAIIGDFSQTGCNSVTNPGCLIGKRVLIYPNTSLGKGYIEDNQIVKLRQALDIVERRV